MRKLLLGFVLTVLLSGCSSPDDSVVEVASDTSIESLESEVSAEPQATVVEPEPEIQPEPEPEPEPEIQPEPDYTDNGSVVKSDSSEMDFSACMLKQAEFSEILLSSGNYKVIPIVDTSILSIVRLCTNDGSVIHTCSAPDNKMVVAMSTNREGC